MKITIDTQYINLAKNLDVLDLCLKESEANTLVDLEINEQTETYIKDEYGMFVDKGGNQIEHCGLLDIISHVGLLFTFASVSTPEPTSAVTTHQCILAELDDLVNGQRVCYGRFIAHNGYFLDTENNFESVSKLQVALWMVNKQAEREQDNLLMEGIKALFNNNGDE